jgi:HlyD family secretion protein
MSGRRRIAIPVVVVIVAAVVVWYTMLRNGSDDIIFASGTVEATEADLGFQAPGRIEGIAVREGDRVVRDQELAQLDRTELLARRQAAPLGPCWPSWSVASVRRKWLKGVRRYALPSSV